MPLRFAWDREFRQGADYWAYGPLHLPTLRRSLMAQRGVAMQMELV